MDEIATVTLARAAGGDVAVSSIHYPYWVVSEGCDILDLADWMERAARWLREQEANAPTTPGE